jgi:hypothetical protein
VEEMGRNSVMPSTIPRITALKKSFILSSYWKCKENHFNLLKYFISGISELPAWILKKAFSQTTIKGKSEVKEMP